jgi:glycosyltransferase involved in cell wall biosynthesis
MKICLVSDGLPGIHREWSGAEVVCATLGEQLHARGVDVCYVTTPASSRRVPGNVYQVSAPLMSLGAISCNFPVDVVSIASAMRRILKIDPDVVHVHSKQLFFPAILSALLLKKPLVLTILDHFPLCPYLLLLKPGGCLCTSYHGWECRQCIVSSQSRLAKALRIMFPQFIIGGIGALRASIFRRLLHRVDLIVTLSDTSKRRYLDYGIPEDQLQVIYHYTVNKDGGTAASFRSLDEGPFVLFVGWLSSSKGLHIAVRALKGITPQHPAVRLVVVGTPVGSEAYKHAVEAEIERLGLRDRVIFMGKRPNDEVLGLIRRSSAVIVPEQWPNDFGPVILVEAMALGKPVVASRLGATGEFIRDGVDGYLVEHNDAQAYAERLSRLLGNEGLAREMGDRARAAVAFLDDAAQFEKIIASYAALIEKAN